MSSYRVLAKYYDRLTGDVQYGNFADFYESEFKRNGGEFRLLLDLCCGTGTLTEIMLNRGYDIIAVDNSEDMLMEARDKYAYSGEDNEKIPLFLCQEADKLDLYGTVDAAYCSLDGINYLSAVKLGRMLSRLKHFVRPGGLFIFDVRTSNFFTQTDGSILVDEDDGVLCLWRADYYPEKRKMIYGMDIFSSLDDLGNSWSREKEEHIEYYHSVDSLNKLLVKNSFNNIRVCEKLLDNDPERMFISAERI